MFALLRLCSQATEIAAAGEGLRGPGGQAVGVRNSAARHCEQEFRNKRSPGMVALADESSGGQILRPLAVRATAKFVRGFRQHRCCDISPYAGDDRFPVVNLDADRPCVLTRRSELGGPHAEDLA